MSIYENKPTVKHAGILYSAAVLLLFFAGSRVQSADFYRGIIITEYVFILMPVVIYVILCKIDFKEQFRMKPIGILNLFLIFCIMIFSIPVVSILNLLNLWAIKSIFGNVILVSIPQAENMAGLFLNILVVGVSAGICEEVLFRGVIQRGMEKYGVKASIIYTALLFGLIHLDFQRLLGTAILGGLIGFIVYRTNSLYGGIFAHFVNNSAAVVISFVSSKLLGEMVPPQFNTGSDYMTEYFENLQSMPGNQLAVIISSWIFMLLFAGAILAGLFIAFTRTTSDKKQIPDKNIQRSNKGLVWFIPGLAVVAFVYTVIAFQLTGTNMGLLETILEVIR